MMVTKAKAAVEEPAVDPVVEPAVDPVVAPAVDPTPADPQVSAEPVSDVSTPVEFDPATGRVARRVAVPEPIPRVLEAGGAAPEFPYTKEEWSGIPIFRCGLCGDTFERDEGLIFQHRQEEHGYRPPKTSVPVTDADGNVVAYTEA